MIRYLAYRYDDLPCLWLTEEGKRLSYNGVYQDLRRLMQRAGISGQVKDMCHIFRRTSAAIAVPESIPRQYVLNRWRWENAAMLDHYVEAMVREEEEASQEFRLKDPIGKWLQRGLDGKKWGS